MTHLDASKMAGSIRGLFPHTLPDQIDFLAREFVQFEEGDVRKAIERHLRYYPEIKISTLLADIAPRHMVRDLTEEQRATAKQEEIRITKVHAKTDADYLRLTKGMSQEEIDALKAQVLKENPDVEDAWKECDPAKCYSLRWHIVQILSRKK
jgi:hypothetical protein